MDIRDNSKMISRYGSTIHLVKSRCSLFEYLYRQTPNVKLSMYCQIPSSPKFSIIRLIRMLQIDRRCRHQTASRRGYWVPLQLHSRLGIVVKSYNFGSGDEAENMTFVLTAELHNAHIRYGICFHRKSNP